MKLTVKAGKFFKSSSKVDVSTSTFADLEIGTIIEVGEFFWIPGEDMIGHDSDAAHGNCSKHGCGSVDVGCWLTVRAVKNGYAIVRLDRPQMPYGARAPIGAVFQIPIAQIRQWPEVVAERRGRENQRSALAAQFCR